MHRAIGRIVILLAFLAITVGCAATNPVTDLNARITSVRMIAKQPPDATYIVEPPDGITIEFMSDPTLTRSVALRSDGTVTLPYLEDVEVAGLTTIQIREKLESLYSRYYREPKILVSVSGFNSKHIYVWGEVGTPRAVSYSGYMTLRDALGQAGGVTTRAAIRRVKVIRGDPEHPEIFRSDVYKMLLEGDTTQDVSLAENDVVRVPPTVLAWIGYRVDEVLFPFRSLLGAYGTYTAAASIGN